MLIPHLVKVFNQMMPPAGHRHCLTCAVCPPTEENVVASEIRAAFCGTPPTLSGRHLREWSGRRRPCRRVQRMPSSFSVRGSRVEKSAILIEP